MLEARRGGVRATSALHRTAPLVALLLVACGGERGDPVLRCSVAGRTDVCRNETLAVKLAAAVLPASVTEHTFQVVEVPGGRPVRGRREVHGALLEFHPGHPLRADLADSGLLAGRTYRLTLRGAPALACVRLLDGSPLESGFSADFETRAEGTGPEFLDPVPGAPALRSHAVESEEGSWWLRFSEPLDPRSLQGLSCRLVGPWHVAALPEADPLLEVELVNNDPAVLRLTPPAALAASLQPELEYSLNLPFSKLLDFGERSLEQSGGDLRVRLRWNPGGPGARKGGS